jgi:hypothetical protein
MSTVTALTAQLDEAYKQSSDAEQRITSLSVRLIELTVRHALPAASAVVVDWDSDGLVPTAIVDADGAAIPDTDEVAGDIMAWTTNIRHPELAGMVTLSTQCREDGPFRLDLRQLHAVYAG